MSTIFLLSLYPFKISPNDEMIHTNEVILRCNDLLDSSLSSVIIRVSVALKRTVGDSD